MKKLLYMFVFLFVGSVFGQDFSSSINTYLNSNQSELSLQSQDIEDVVIDRHSYSESMDVENVYAIQKYQGIEIFNSVSSFAIKNGQVQNASLSFSKDVSQKVNTTTPAISATTAIGNAALELGIKSPTNLELLETVSVNSFVYSNGSISLENIPVKLVFQKMEDSSLRLAWDLSIYVLDASHYYSVRIDAITGTILNVGDWVVSCSFGEHKDHSDLTHTEKSVLFPKEETAMITSGGAQYRVWPFPFESPNNGSSALVADPSQDGAGSPYGWHDTNGSPGAEYEITRGNNVWAKEDISGTNTGGASADGGPDLNFDFAFDFNENPNLSVDASIVNLFYGSNMMHDIYYQYGFNEASGNFQQNNYGLGGIGNDYVNADAQDGAGTNNATMSTPPDGSKPRITMYLWDGTVISGPLLTINDGPLAGDYDGVPAAFGGDIVDLTEDLVVVEDDESTGDINDACDPIINGAALDGKIAVIRRGECEFGFKALAAENEGAVAVIMVNNVEGEAITMAPGAVGDQVTIPLFMVTDVDGEAIIAELLTGGTVNATINGVTTGPMIDGDLDNGIVAHEYGHGISNRLTGGANNTGCLNNAQQMGEGWSDWVGLMITMQAGDQADDARGIGTYAIGEPADGVGIRQYPYSYNMSINPLTYGNLAATGGQVHAVGTIWATMIWDLNWDLIAEYGYDPDMYNGNGGNNIAMQLILDGMKLQPCSPGFVDGRDAILEADELANGGANRCIIWNAFARRGLGFSAIQGSSNSVTGSTAAIDIPADCENLGINDTNLDDKFIIYPNPSNGNINIKPLIDFGDANVSIYDINGRKVYKTAVNLQNTVSINTQNLSAGMYIMQIEGADYSHTAKLIIN